MKRKRPFKKPRTIADLKKIDSKYGYGYHEELLRAQFKTGCTLKEFINEMFK